MKLRWRKNPEPWSPGHALSRWQAVDTDGNVMAEAAMDGRRGVDDYPWGWHVTFKTSAKRTSGVTDTLRDAKDMVNLAWENRVQ